MCGLCVVCLSLTWSTIFCDVKVFCSSIAGFVTITMGAIRTFFLFPKVLKSAIFVLIFSQCQERLLRPSESSKSSFKDLFNSFLTLRAARGLLSSKLRALQNKVSKARNNYLITVSKLAYSMEDCLSCSTYFFNFMQIISRQML